MPELPEVETVRRGLEKLIVGARIEGVDFDWPKSFPNDPVQVDAFLVGARFRAARRRAKVLLIDLDSAWSLAVHLKMTGQLVYVDGRGPDGGPDAGPDGGPNSVPDGGRWGAGHPSASLVGNLPDKSTRVVLELDRGRLFFNDQRKFGWMRLLPTADLAAEAFLRKLGPEPLESAFTAADFDACLRRRPNGKIKAVILDQTIVAGVGNIYADEALWRAGIHPETPVSTLNGERTAALLHGIREAMFLSLEQGGSSSRNYVDADGKRGYYLDFAAVFGRQGQACRRCGSAIIKIRSCGRGTHLCPVCQSEPKRS